MSSGTMFILQPLSLYYTPLLVSPHPQPPPPPHHFANIQHLLYHQSSLKASGRTERRRRRKRRMKGLHSEHHSTNITATVSSSISSCSSSNERTQFGETKVNDKCTELADEDIGDGQCDKEVLPDGESVFKRHCRVCSKTLTCPLQAQQHFNGKRHLRRLKRYIDIEACYDTSLRHSAEKKTIDNCDWSADGGDEDAVEDSCVGQDQSHVIASRVRRQQELTADVYCSLCDVSFNSSQQSADHYRGKAHLRKSSAHLQRMRHNHRPSQPSIHNLPSYSDLSLK